MATTQLTPTRNGGGIAAKPLRQVENVRELLMNDMAKQQLASVAAQHMRPERMMRLMANSLRTTPQLAECEPLSLLGSMMTCASLGLEPNTPLGHAYLLPFKNSRKNVTEVQLVIGYKGMIDLARRSGHIVNIHGDVVYQGDDFSFEYGSNQHLTHRPRGKRETPVYAYCHAKLTDGEAFVVLPWDQVLEIRNGSQGYKTAVKYGKKDSPWMAHQHEMAAKTAVRALFKYLPISIELSNSGLGDALTADEGRVDFAAFAANPQDGPVIEGEAEDVDDEAQASLEDQRASQQIIDQKPAAEKQEAAPRSRAKATQRVEAKPTAKAEEGKLALDDAPGEEIGVLVSSVRQWIEDDMLDGATAAQALANYSDQLDQIQRADQAAHDALVAEVEGFETGRDT